MTKWSILQKNTPKKFYEIDYWSLSERGKLHYQTKGGYGGRGEVFSPFYKI